MLTTWRVVGTSPKHLELAPPIERNTPMVSCGLLSAVRKTPKIRLVYCLLTVPDLKERSFAKIVRMLARLMI